MTVRHSLLALLAEEPATGYGLKQRYEDRTGALWPVNIGQVYTTLGRLERDGLVARDDDEAPYALTAAGRELLADWLLEPVSPSGMRDDLVVKVLLAWGVPGVEPADVIQRHRTALVEELQRLARRRDDDDLTWTMTVDAVVLRLDASIRWLDRCEARLAAHGRGDGDGGAR